MLSSCASFRMKSLILMLPVYLFVISAKMSKIVFPVVVMIVLKTSFR